MAAAEDEKLLEKIYYKDGVVVGRDKLYRYVKENYPNHKITRRAIAEWIARQEKTQLHKKHQKPKGIKSTVLKQPHAQLGIDLVDMQVFEGKGGYKYLLNGVDLFSRKMYSIPIKNKEDSTVLKALDIIIKIANFIMNITIRL